MRLDLSVLGEHRWVFAPRVGTAVLTVLLAGVGCLTGCGGSSKSQTTPTTIATGITAEPTTPAAGTSTTLTSPVGQQLWSTYLSANDLYDQLIASPNGRSTDPRLRQYATGQWLSEVARQINELRLKNEVEKGPDQLTGFVLVNVTGAIGTFDACDSNNQNIYSVSTGAEIPSSTPGELSTDMQITETNASGKWLVEQVALNQGKSCAAS